MRVHPEFLEKQKLPPDSSRKDIWKERFQDIRYFERYLTRNGVVIRKFFLNVSKGEQKRAFSRTRSRSRRRTGSSRPPTSRSARSGTITWTAYEDMIRHTATPEAPWYVVPADNKWFTRIVVAAAVIETLDALDLHYPKVSKEKLKELAAAKTGVDRWQGIVNWASIAPVPQPQSKIGVAGDAPLLTGLPGLPR